jgi:SAM-dependent methyltransferase
LARVRELLELVRRVRHDALGEAAAVDAHLRSIERRVVEEFGLPSEGLRVVDLGCGQQLRHAAWLSVKHAVVGVDLDVVPVSVSDYRVMWVENGPYRTVKTVGRQLLGVDRRFHAALRRRVGPAGAIELVRSDVARPDLAGDSFDWAVSFDTFEHLANPRAAAREVRRVLRPGGVAWIELHLYTSDTGHHDLRVRKSALAAGERALPHWAHLRPHLVERVRPNAWLNRFSLTEWRELFAAELPGCRVDLSRDQRALLPAALARLRERGELSAWTDDDLLTEDVVIAWQKPR